MADESGESTIEDLVSAIAAAVKKRGLTVAVAESVTAGNIAAALATGEGASDWLHGGVVAFSAHAKNALLGVPEGPLITPECAETMARGVASRLRADIAVATTGVGGPDPLEGHPPGTVWFGFVNGSQSGAECQHFDGDVPRVVDAAVRRALELLREQAHADD